MLVLGLLTALGLGAWAGFDAEGLEPLLAAVGEVETVEPGTLADRERLDRLDLLVWDTRSRRLPPAATTPEAIEAVRAWIEGGGNVLLFSHALRWMHDLGLEPVAPDRADGRLLGHSDAYSQGRYDYGFEADEPDHPLFRELEPAREGANVFFLAGEHALWSEACFWEGSEPTRAVVLGAFSRRAYGEDRTFSHRALVSLQAGEGRVLAYGSGPLFTSGNPHARNLARFVENAVRWLCGEPQGSTRRPRIGLLPPSPAQLAIDGYSSGPPEPLPAPRFWKVAGPHLPYLAHWGWLGQVDYQRAGRESADLRYLCARVVDESAFWGANLLEFYPPDMEHGFPIPWEEEDPLPRPEFYWGGGFDPAWDAERTRELTAHARSRGFLVHAFHHPNPVRPPLDNFVAYAERSARDFANPLLHGSARSWDGFGTEWFPVDHEARITAALWKYNPGAYQHSTAVLPAYTPNFSATLMCAFGRLGSLNACGYSDQWRNVYHAPLYLSYQADCRTRKPSERVWGGWGRYGGGSYPDWILRQVNDFCRPRLDADSAIWWLGEPESTLHPRYRDYVYGISMDPIRCAVACRLWATGRGGYRETIAKLSPDPPPGYASGPDLPFDAAILQNNFLRLVRRRDRDQGMLLLDPLHLARFDPDVTGEERAVVLLEDFLAPGRSELDEAVNESVVRMGEPNGRAEGRGAEGYEEEHAVRPDGVLPARLARDATPEWPGRLRLVFPARVGTHLLRIGVLEGDEPGLVEVFLDGDPVGFYVTGARDAGEARDVVREFELGIVDRGEHELVLSVQSGPGHALDFLTVHRVTTGAIRHAVPEKAGARATLLETIAVETDAGEVREERTYSLIADDPVLHVARVRTGPGVEGGALIDEIRLPRSAAEGIAGAGRYARHDPTGLALGLRRIASAETDATPPDAVALGVFSERARCIAFLEDGPLPRVRVVALPRPDPVDDSLPRVFVRETDADGRAWWVVRGAQSHGDEFLVKIYDRVQARTQLRHAPFLENGFRPGWGCQHVLAIEDVGRRGSCRVRVEKVGPFLFAPRVELDGPVRSVILDGEDWRYFDESTIFLPNRRGEYDLRVETNGPELPSISRTFLTVSESRWIDANDTLRIVTEPPAGYSGTLPGGRDYTLMIRTRGRRLVEASGAEVVPFDEYPLRSEADRGAMEAAGVVLRLRPGISVLRFER